MRYSAHFLDTSNDDGYVHHSISNIDADPNPQSHHLRKKVLVCEHDAPVLLINVYVEVDKDGYITDSCFCEMLSNDEYVAILSGQHVHIVEISSKQVKSIRLGDYVGHIYSIPNPASTELSENFLVATYCYVFLLNLTKGILWQSRMCAIDGVVIDNIDGDIISAQGEWDPPGGWVDFKLSLNTGVLIKNLKTQPGVRDNRHVGQRAMKTIETLRAELLAIGEQLGGGVRPNHYFIIPDKPDYFATPYLEIHDQEYHFVVNERGMEIARKVTPSDDEILYWFTSCGVNALASSYAATHASPDEEFRTAYFRKRFYLMLSIKTAWATREKNEIKSHLHV